MLNVHDKPKRSYSKLRKLTANSKKTHNTRSLKDDRLQKNGAILFPASKRITKYDPFKE